MKIINEAEMPEEYMAIVKEIVENIINNNSELDLRELECVKIVNVLDNANADGRYENNCILFSKSKTENYIRMRDFNTIKSTFYHELCHVDLKSKLPQLHILSEKYKREKKYIKFFTIMVYIEYVCHLMSLKYETEENVKRFLESVNNRKWNFNDEITKIYFIKYASYILGRINNNFDYINIIESDEVKERLVKLKKILERINRFGVIHDYNNLLELEKYVSKYINDD